VFENVPEADAGETSQTMGAASSARATKIPKSLGNLPFNITKNPLHREYDCPNFNSAQQAYTLRSPAWHLQNLDPQDL
jgi:hypothetical protein